MEYRHITNGTIEINSGSELKLFGIHNGTLIIKGGAKCYIYGILNGSLINQGHTEIFGMVNKFHNSGSPVLFHKGSFCNGVEFVEDTLTTSE